MKFRQGLHHFRWERCPDGYDIVREQPRPPLHPGESLIGQKLPEGWVGSDTLRPRSRRTENYPAMQEAADIHRRYQQVPANEESAISLVEQFGLLGGDVLNLPRETPLKNVFDLQKSIKQIMRTSSRPAGEVASKFNRKFPLGASHFYLSMHPDSEVTPIFHIIPSNLTNFIILRLASELEGGIEWRSCANPSCSQIFQVAEGRGAVSEKRAGTKRKITCGKESCRKAVQRLRKKSANQKR